MELTNTSVAKMLREVAAAYTLKKGNLFQIRAYEGAADSIERLTVEAKDLWEEGRLDQIPGVGESLQDHLNELFKRGKVKHWEDVKKGIPEPIFQLLDVPGIGPKIAWKLSKLGIKSIDSLKQQIKSKALIKKGFSEKLALRIGEGLGQVGVTKTGRMLLPYAFNQAKKVLDYLKNNPAVEKADALGSLRRMVVTVGDIDLAVASKKPKEIVEHILSMPGISRVVEKGERKMTIALTNGVQVDFLIINPESYGSSLQYFTGSKLHNIHIRTVAEKLGLSLSEYGVKNTKTGQLHPTPTEKEFYGLLDMEVPPPEIREDTGEVEAALTHKLPSLVELEDIKGDLHLHSNFPIEPAHDPGINSIEDMANVGKELGYLYIGISDHQPSQVNHTKEQMVKILKKRKGIIEHINSSYKKIRVLNLLEVDILPDGRLGVPDEGLKLLDFAIAGVHSVHRQPREKMTARILKALQNPYVKVLTHPTNRLLNERESSEVEWKEIFKFVTRNNQALEINAWPNRLDLVDSLVKEAKEFGVKFVINTDAHEKSAMEYMKFGVAVARRGWATKEDIVNSWEWTKFVKWFNIKK